MKNIIIFAFIVRLITFTAWPEIKCDSYKRIITGNWIIYECYNKNKELIGELVANTGKRTIFLVTEVED